MQKTVFCFSLLFGLGLCLAGCKKDSDKSATPAVQPVVLPEPVIVESGFYSAPVSDSSLPNGEILMALSAGDQGRLFLLDQRGSKIRAATVAQKVENLQKWKINGQVRYSYFFSAGLITLDNIPGTELGYAAVCDSDLNLLYTVALLPHGRVDTAIQDMVDAHEFILLGEQHYIVESYFPATPGNIPDPVDARPGSKVSACIIQEVDHGQVIFQWDGTDYPEFYGASVENDNFLDSARQDYMHLNSICIDSLDGNLIVSFRNLNQIVKIDRHTGAIIWRLGGKTSDFRLTPEQSFLRQHYVRFRPGTRQLMFLDNGQITDRPYSRVVTFDLDEEKRAVTGFNSWPIPRFIQFAGSVQLLGSHYFIGGGSASYVSETDTVTRKVLLQLELKYPSYRTLKY